MISFSIDLESLVISLHLGRNQLKCIYSKGMSNKGTAAACCSYTLFNEKVRFPSSKLPNAGYICLLLLYEGI